MRIAALVAALIAVGFPAIAAEPAKPVGKTKRPPAAAEHHPSALLAEAQKGDAQAQTLLGIAYRDGKGVKADPRSALVWFGLAAANGSAAAAANAAAMVDKGQGTKRDTGLLARLLYRAAVLGDAPSRDAWLRLTLSGGNASLDGEKGVAWLAEAAAQGDRHAPMILAEGYRRGLGVVANASAAEYWLRQAVTLYGDVEAEYRLGRLLLAAPAAWRMPTEEEWSLKEAERRGVPFGARPLAAKPVDQDDSKLSLIRPGMVEGERHLRRAARRGYAEAQYALGMALVSGMELPLDTAQGARWLEAAAAQGHSEALAALAALAAEGIGLFTKDPVRAWVLYDLAASSGEEGAAAARDALGRGLNQRQAARARLIVQGVREAQGL